MFAKLTGFHLRCIVSHHKLLLICTKNAVDKAQAYELCKSYTQKNKIIEDIVWQDHI